eukprot:gene2411-2715_t
MPVFNNEKPMKKRMTIEGHRKERYRLSRSLGSGTCLRSDTFAAGGQQFQLEVFPAGASADSSHHVSVFLTSPGCQNPNVVLYEIAVIDQVWGLGPGLRTVTARAGLGWAGPWEGHVDLSHWPIQQFSAT